MKWPVLALLVVALSGCGGVATVDPQPAFTPRVTYYAVTQPTATVDQVATKAPIQTSVALPTLAVTPSTTASSVPQPTITLRPTATALPRPSPTSTPMPPPPTATRPVPTWTPKPAPTAAPAAIPAAAIPPPTGNLCAFISGASIVAYDGVYLGRLTNRYDEQSIYNPYGTYGSRYQSNSVNNPYGTYGSEYSALSPNNRYTSNPPVLVKNGASLAYFTINPYKAPYVIPAYAATCNFP